MRCAGLGLARVRSTASQGTLRVPQVPDTSRRAGTSLESRLPSSLGLINSSARLDKHLGALEATLARKIPSATGGDGHEPSD